MPACRQESSMAYGASRRKASETLQDMTSARGCFSGCAIDYRRPCTSGEGRLCDIFRELPSWNEFFWHLRLQLRELSPGQLSLVETDGAGVCSKPIEEYRPATTLLCHLLMLHRCVTSVTLNRDIIVLRDELICVCDALRQSSNLRKLEMSAHGKIYKTESYRLISVLPHLTLLRELVLRSVELDYASSKRLSKFLASTRSLTTLRMTDQFYKEDNAVLVAQGLKRNVTITTLLLTKDLIEEFWPSRDAIIAFFRDVSALRALTVTAHLRFWDEVSPIVEPMFFNNTISELNLTGFIIYIKDIQLIGKLLIENGTLKSLHFLDCVYRQTPQDDAKTCVNNSQNFGNVSSRIHPWVLALAENETLEELTLSLTWYNADEWRSFFEALASNASLKKVKVSEFPRNGVAEIFRAMRETGVEERFFVGVHHIFAEAAVARTPFAPLWSLEIDRTTYPAFEPPLRAPFLLQSFCHMTSLCMLFEIEMWNVTASSLIAQCTTSVVALRELELIFRHQWRYKYADHIVQRALVKAVQVGCYASFASAHKDYESTLMFLRKLSPIVSSNYTLLGLHLIRSPDLGSDFFAVAEVVRRNNSLVTRAAAFVEGTMDKYCAEALEIVHSTPGLVARVQSSASTDESEAVLKIRRNLNNLCELDCFMRVAGVVKSSVTCYRHADGGMQLTDLNRDCWLYVKRYLKVSDILDEK
ncbi:hypothetical protein MTO96_027618 [Rhipicephalus appendiculatus]